MQSQRSSETTHSTITGTTGGISTTGDAIDMLLHDHTRIKALLEEIATRQVGAVKQQTLEELKQLLTIHNATEENFVYPALAKVAGKRHESEHLYHETAEADMLLFEMDTCLKTGDAERFEKYAQELRGAILEHIDDEEQKAFPQLREKSEPEQAQMLNKSVQKFRSSLRFQQA